MKPVHAATSLPDPQPRASAGAPAPDVTLDQRAYPGFLQVVATAGTGLVLIAAVAGLARSGRQARQPQTTELARTGNETAPLPIPSVAAPSTVHDIAEHHPRPG